MKVYAPLNFLNFKKLEAEKELNELYDWKPFKHKHHESRFTVFFEDYWLPKRFGYEKRRAHFSSLILTGQMDRKEALSRISKPELQGEKMEKEIEFVCDKLEITPNYLDKLFNVPKRTFRDYKNKRWLIMLAAKIFRFLGIEKRYFRK